VPGQLQPFVMPRPSACPRAAEPEGKPPEAPCHEPGSGWKTARPAPRAPRPTEEGPWLRGSTVARERPREAGGFDTAIDWSQRPLLHGSNANEKRRQRQTPTGRSSGSRGITDQRFSCRAARTSRSSNQPPEPKATTNLERAGSRSTATVCYAATQRRPAGRGT
jgi:hypothetical protein